MNVHATYSRISTAMLLFSECWYCSYYQPLFIHVFATKHRPVACWSHPISMNLIARRTDIFTKAQLMIGSQLLHALKGNFQRQRGLVRLATVNKMPSRSDEFPSFISRSSEVAIKICLMCVRSDEKNTFVKSQKTWSRISFSWVDQNLDTCPRVKQVW